MKNALFVIIIICLFGAAPVLIPISLSLKLQLEEKRESLDKRWNVQ